MYETFDHTADLGLRIKAPTLNQLFEEAAAALFTTLIDDLAAVESRQSIKVHLAGDDLPYLLFDWLRELLYRFEADRVLFGRFKVTIADGKLDGDAWGEPIDRDRHALSHEVKAITYHGLLVQQKPDGWLAEVIVDI